MNQKFYKTVGNHLNNVTVNHNVVSDRVYNDSEVMNRDDGKNEAHIQGNRFVLLINSRSGSNHIQMAVNTLA